ncbi:MAG: Na+/H+ antiporter subunit D [Planctomycetes bacterium]|nr:Na+/H+ antiporter subunit D [Planctomycetota bacterium]
MLTRGLPRLHGPLNVACMAALAAVGAALLARVHDGAVLVTFLGGWRAPFGIPLVADALSVTMVLVTALVAGCVCLYALVDVPPRQALVYHAVTPVLVASANGAFLTGDLFNLYVWFEVMLMSSFVLMALGGEAPQVRGTVKYMATNLVSSTLFLAGVGLLYGLTGTLNMAELAARVPALGQPALVSVVAVLFVVAFGTKAAVFPLFSWLPASYPTPPVATTALFAGLLTKVAVYALLRTFTLIFVHDVGFTHGALLWIAGLTMVTGVLGAVAQDEVRRLLSFHIVSQIGYMVMGLALLSPLALLGAIFFTIHNILAKTNLFLIGGVMARLGGSFELKRLGGFYRAQPLLAGLFLVPALALAGVPPLSGFWGKLLLARAGLEAAEYAIVAASLAVGLLTLYSMMKIWSQAVLPAAADPARPPAGPVPRAQLAAIGVLAASTLALSALAWPVCVVLGRAAEGLLAPTAYIEAVLRA